MKKDENFEEKEEKKIIKYELPLLERLVYWGAWGSFVLYILFRFRMACIRNLKHIIHNLSVGNSLLPTYIADDSDYQYTETFSSVTTILPLLIAHSILANIIKKYVPKFLRVFHIAVSCVGLFQLMGIKGIFLAFGTTVIPFTICWFLRNNLVPYAWLAFRLSEVFLPDWMNIKLAVGKDDFHALFTSFVCEGWLLCRNISFCVDHYTKYPNGKGYWEDLLSFLSYAFYLPYVFAGPFVRYQDFETSLRIPYRGWNFQRFFKTLLLFAYNIALLYGPDIWQHFFYNSILSFYTNIVVTFDNFELAGLFYAAFLNHFLKTLMSFGIPILVSDIEGMYKQTQSQCPVLISRVSQTYRNLDVGLYQFLLTYVFIPVRNHIHFINSKVFSKLAGVCIVNCILLTWHQPKLHNAYFLGLNFLAYILENATDYVMPLEKLKTDGKISLFRYCLLFRVKCVFLGFAAFFPQVAGLFFLSRNADIGLEALKRFHEGLFSGFLIVLAVNYCIMQVGADWASYMKNKNITQRKIKLDENKKEN